MRTFLHWVVAYIAVGLSAGLAAWSGARGADATLADAGIKAAIMFVIAMLGCHGWAWAARLSKDGHRGWALASWLILSFALAVTLLGSAGSFYSAATERISTAERGGDAYKRADAELKRIEAKRKKLTEHRSVGEIEPDITTLKADRRYKTTEGCAPEHITKSAAFCAQFRKLEQEKAAAKEADRLDAQAAKHLAIVSKGQPTAYGGPGDIIAATFGTTQQMGNAVFSLMCTLALDFGAVMALVTAELRNPHDHKREPEPRTLDRLFQRRRQAPGAPRSLELAIATPVIDIEPERPRVPARPRPKLAASTRQPAGAVLDFLHEAVEIVDGATKIEMSDACIGYAAWCKAKSLRAMGPADFFNEMADLCAQFGIPIQEEAGCVYLGNVRLMSSAMASEGP